MEQPLSQEELREFEEYMEGIEPTQINAAMINSYYAELTKLYDQLSQVSTNYHLASTAEVAQRARSAMRYFKKRIVDTLDMLIALGENVVKPTWYDDPDFRQPPYEPPMPPEGPQAPPIPPEDENENTPAPPDELPPPVPPGLDLTRPIILPPDSSKVANDRRDQIQFRAEYFHEAYDTMFNPPWTVDEINDTLNEMDVQNQFQLTQEVDMFASQYWATLIYKPMNTWQSIIPEWDSILRFLDAVLKQGISPQFYQLNHFGIALKWGWLNRHKQQHYFVIREQTWYGPVNVQEIVNFFMNTTWDYVNLAEIGTKEDDYAFQMLNELKIILLDRTNGVPHDIGYCGEKRGRKIVRGSLELYSPVGEHGDCFFYAINYGLKLKYGREIHPQRMRKRINNFLSSRNMPTIDEGMPFNRIHDILDILECNIVIYNISNNTLVIVFETISNYDQSVELVLDEFHFYYLLGSIDKSKKKTYFCAICKDTSTTPHLPVCPKTQCENCGRYYAKMENHVECHQTFWNRIELEKRGKKLVYSSTKFYEDYNSENVIFYDLETTSNTPLYTYQNQVAYACGFALNNEPVRTFYGWSCIPMFISWLNTLGEEKERFWLIGFNNGNFDNHLLIQDLISKYINPKPIIHNTCIIGMEFENYKGAVIKVIDEYRFLMKPGGTLANLAKDFQLPVQKGCFPYEFLNENHNIYYKGKIPDKNYWKELPEDYDENNIEWDLEKVCIDYLKKDVEITRQLWNILSNKIFDIFHIQLRDFITLSQMSYSIWTSFNCLNISKHNDTTEWYMPCEKPTIQTYTPIVIPNRTLYDISVKACYGGRVINWKQQFKSSKYDDIVAGKIKFEELDEDYIFLADIVSHYPFAMSNFPYPVGKHREVNEKEIRDMNTTVHRDWTKLNMIIGIYEVSMKPNPNLITPVVPRKEVRKNPITGLTSTTELIWDLKPRTGWYTSVDIQMCLESGYLITFLRGVCWEQTGFIFKDYIDHCFEIKSEGQRTGNQALRSIGKLMGNSLYGKMFQKPCVNTVSIIRNSLDAARFMNTNVVEDIYDYHWEEEDPESGDIIEKTAAIMSGVATDIEAKITKPSYLGSFILSYSRKTIHDYMNLIDPYRFSDPKKSLSYTPFYTDTDSMHILITKEIMERLEPFIDENRLGFIANDDKGGGKVIWAIYLAPKCYCYELLQPSGEIKFVAKCKGIPQKLLTKQAFLDRVSGNQNEHVFNFISFRKVGLSNWNNLPPFSIAKENMSRNFVKSKSSQRQYFKDENLSSVPIGFNPNINMNLEQ